jgi:uncharacterized protein YkwD
MEYLRLFNWIDLIIVALWIFFVFEGYRAGFLQQASALLSYFAAMWASLRYYSFVSLFLSEKFGASRLWSDVLGYTILVILVQIIASMLILGFLKKAGRHLIGTKFDNFSGIVLAVINITAVMAFLLFLLLKLPIRGDYKKDISRAYFAPKLLMILDYLGGSVTETLDLVAKEANRFLTVRPESKDIIPLDIKPQAWELSEDLQSEKQFLELINSDRIKNGRVPLSSDHRLAQVAREHSRDMIMRRYFSHYDPDGNDVKTRLNQAGVQFSVAGENLAFAPEVTVAYQGLMESEGHRRNILDSSFSHIGIGVIDAGVYGKMITQVFINAKYFIFHSP